MGKPRHMSKHFTTTGNAAIKLDAFLPRSHPLFSALIPSTQRRTPGQFRVPEPQPANFITPLAEKMYCTSRANMRTRQTQESGGLQTSLSSSTLPQDHREDTGIKSGDHNSERRRSDSMVDSVQRREWLIDAACWKTRSGSEPEDA